MLSSYWQNGSKEAFETAIDGIGNNVMMLFTIALNVISFEIEIWPSGSPSTIVGKKKKKNNLLKSN